MKPRGARVAGVRAEGITTDYTEHTDEDATPIHDRGFPLITPRNPKHDDGLEWLREIRRKMAAQFDHDPRKAAACYQIMQRRYTDRLYRREAIDDAVEA